MSPHGCERFRSALARSLERAQSLDPEHEAHALECAACGALRRGEEGLDELLDLLDPVAVPATLATRVREGLAERGDEDLDRLLDELPVPGVPAGLAGRVLDALAVERRPRPRFRRRPLVLLAAAAGLVLALALWRARSAAVRPDEGVEALPVEVVAPSGPSDGSSDDEELLAYALERWDLLEDDDLDLWLAGLDPVDQALIEVAGDQVLLEVESEGGGGGTDAPR